MSLDKYFIHRCDQVSGRTGGVCLFVANTIYSRCLWDLEDTRYECIWIWLRPNRLPGPLFGIAVCVVYNPPDGGMQELRDLKEYLSYYRHHFGQIFSLWYTCFGRL